MIGTLMTTALLVPPDDRRTLLIANAHHYGSMIFIFCSAILFAILPDAWFEGGPLEEISSGLRMIWPKLDHDVSILNAISSARGTKYSTFILYCVGTLTIGVSLVVPMVWYSMVSGRRGRLKVKEIGAFSILVIPLPFLFFCFFAIFESGFLGGQTKLGQAIAQGGLLWFWVAFLWWSLLTSLATVIVVVVRLLIGHGSAKH